MHKLFLQYAKFTQNVVMHYIAIVAITFSAIVSSS